MSALEWRCRNGDCLLVRENRPSADRAQHFGEDQRRVGVVDRDELRRGIKRRRQADHAPVAPKRNRLAKTDRRFAVTSLGQVELGQLR